MPVISELFEHSYQILAGSSISLELVKLAQSLWERPTACQPQGPWLLRFAEAFKIIGIVQIPHRDVA